MTPREVQNHLDEILNRAIEVNAHWARELGRELTLTEGLLVVLNGLEPTPEQRLAIRLELDRLALEARNSEARVFPHGLDDIGQFFWIEAAQGVVEKGETGK